MLIIQLSFSTIGGQERLKRGIQSAQNIKKRNHMMGIGIGTRTYIKQGQPQNKWSARTRNSYFI